MSLALVPYDVLEKLVLAPTAEAEGQGKFDLKQFDHDLAEAIASGVSVKLWLQQYLALHGGATLAGTGSSRVAFFIPASSLDVPGATAGCLKVAWNRKGVAQNLAEDEIFSKYGDLPCFPKVFDRDPKGNWCLTECGSRLDEPRIGLNYKKLATDWDHIVWKESKLPTDSAQTLKLGLRGDYMSAYDFVSSVRWSMEGAWATVYSPGPKYEDIKRFTEDDLPGLVTSKPALQPILGLLQFTFKFGWREVILADLGSEVNWAVVFRPAPGGGLPAKVPIPIDWGYTNKVQMEFY